MKRHRVCDTKKIEVEFQRLRSEIALRDRCIAWCLGNGARYGYNGIWRNRSAYDAEKLPVPAEFDAIIGGKA